MMRRAWLAVILVACKRSDPPAPMTTIVTSAAPSETAPEIEPTPTAEAIIGKWDLAHEKHDADALEKLYAARVLFYGKDMTAAEAAAKKRAAFASTPDYRQGVGRIATEPGPDETTWARFDKIVTDKKGQQTFPMLARIDASNHIVEESDDVTKDSDWCWKRPAPEPNDRVVPPFRISASRAADGITKSKYIAGLRRKGHDIVLDPYNGFKCARRCATPSHDCNFSFRISDLSIKGTSSNFAGNIEVDPLTSTIYVGTWEDGGEQWLAEPIP